MGLLKTRTMINSLCIGWRAKRRAWVGGDMHARFILLAGGRAEPRCRFESDGVMRCSSKLWFLPVGWQGRRGKNLLVRIVITMACSVRGVWGCLWCMWCVWIGAMGRRLLRRFGASTERCARHNQQNHLVCAMSRSPGPTHNEKLKDRNRTTRCEGGRLSCGGLAHTQPQKPRV